MATADKRAINIDFIGSTIRADRSSARGGKYQRKSGLPYRETLFDNSSFSLWLRASGGLTFRLVAVFHGCLATELHAALVVDADAFDPHRVTHLDDILDLVDADVSEFGNMAKTILAWQDLNEGSKFFDRDNGALISSPTVISLVMPWMISLARWRLSPLFE